MKNNNSKELIVPKIKDGTVIDHLPARSALSILKLLGIGRSFDNTVSVVMNVSSKSEKCKDIVKIQNRVLTEKETGKIALVAPKATVNIIKNYDVVKKRRVEVPKEILNMIKCANPNCITNQNEPILPIFKVEKNNPILLRCKFCERVMDRELIEQQF